MIDSFKDTSIALSHLSDADLKRAIWMFRLIGAPYLVNIGEKLINCGLRIGLPVKPLIRATLFKQFAGGESAEECFPVIEKLWKYKIGTILDYSVEGQKVEAEFDQTIQEISKTIEIAASRSEIPFCVFKTSGLAPHEVLEKGTSHPHFELARNRVQKILKLASEKNVPVMIDAEESWIQNSIDLITEEMMRSFNRNSCIVFTTIQLYRKDRLNFLKKLIDQAKSENFRIGVKLVRGAYMEKEAIRALENGYPNPIQENKLDTDHDFNAALELCVQNIEIVSLVAGTHNEESTIILTKLLDKYHLDRGDKRVWFSQLLGMGDYLTFPLAQAGYNVAKYVPYAPIQSLIPYLVRRARENTSVRGQTGRELFLLRTELQRRRKAKLA